MRAAGDPSVLYFGTNGRSSHTRVVGAYARKGWQVIAVAGWGIGVIGSTHVGAYGPVIARVRLRCVVAEIVRRAIAVICAIAVSGHSRRCGYISRAAVCPAVDPSMDARNPGFSAVNR